MDRKLLAWARGVKARQHTPRGGAVLWLFTDARRLADPLGAVARLPAGLCGVVFRHDGDPRREALGWALARLCRARGLPMVVAGDWRLAAALGAGLHLRGGRKPAQAPRWHGLITSSAHGVAELRRARGAGAGLVFLSPAFATVSHPGARALGAARWGRLARGAGVAVAGLGGVGGNNVRRLPSRYCVGAGAIGALT
jgi:thiamine-phosphate pyrophosphorylase